MFFTVKGNGASNPEASLRIRKAWCGFFDADPSFVVRDTLIFSPTPSDTTGSTCDLSDNLWTWGEPPALGESSTVPSEKVHDEAAWATPARRAIEEATENHIVRNWAGVDGRSRMLALQLELGELHEGAPCGLRGWTASYVLIGDKIVGRECAINQLEAAIR